MCQVYFWNKFVFSLNIVATSNNQYMNFAHCWCDVGSAVTTSIVPMCVGGWWFNVFCLFNVYRVVIKCSIILGVLLMSPCKRKSCNHQIKRFDYDKFISCKRQRIMIIQLFHWYARMWPAHVVVLMKSCIGARVCTLLSHPNKLTPHLIPCWICKTTLIALPSNGLQDSLGVLVCF